MEYKLSSFKFSNNVKREDKNHVIMRINSIRSKCPSDARFTGEFSESNKVFNGEIKVLFSKGSFLVNKSGANIAELMTIILNSLEDQIAMWKEIRFNQPEDFIDYSKKPAKKKATANSY